MSLSVSTRVVNMRTMVPASRNPMVIHDSCPVLLLLNVSMICAAFEASVSAPLQRSSSGQRRRGRWREPARKPTCSATTRQMLRGDAAAASVVRHHMSTTNATCCVTSDKFSAQVLD